MINYTKARVVKLLEIDFIRFCIVGGTGFVINAVLLSIFNQVINLPIIIAQFLAAEIALFSNFMLHHHWTYKRNKVEKTFGTLLVQFHATTWPAIIGSAIMVDLGVRIFHLPTIEALILSSAIALLWNFGWSKYVVWRDVSRREVKELVE
jgi:dolichol-phosphate mannosyltransferase